VNSSINKENEVCITPSTLRRCCDVCVADVGLQLQASNDCMAFQNCLVLASTTSACLSKLNWTHADLGCYWSVD